MPAIRKTVAPLAPDRTGSATGARQPRRLVAALSTLLVAVLLAAVVVMVQAGRPGAAGGLSGAAPGAAAPAPAPGTTASVPSNDASGLTEALSHPFVTDADRSARTVTVDMSQDPDAVYAWMESTDEELDGWTIEVAGIGTPDRARSREVDTRAHETSGDRPVTLASEPCPDIPTGPRTEDGTTVPYLGCDPATGPRSAVAAATGGTERSLGAAVDTVLAELVPGADLAPATVTLTQGDAVVDLPARFVDAAERATVPAYEIDRALIFTAYSNGALDSVRFRAGGDCLAYAYATDGDVCATVSLPIDLDTKDEE